MKGNDKEYNNNNNSTGYMSVRKRNNMKKLILAFALIQLGCDATQDECECIKETYLIRQEVNPTRIIHELQSTEIVQCQYESQRVQIGTGKSYYNIVCN